MSSFAIIEVEDGLTVVELKSHETTENAAIKHQGTLEPISEPYDR
jgi:hypothetical protein